MTTALPPRGWYSDPDNAAGKRWWSGTAWTERRRVAPPVGTLTISLFAFTTLGLITAYTMWPQNGASCEERPPSVAPFWVSLSLWTLGVGLAVALVVIAFRRWNPSAFTVPVLVGAVLLPWLVAMLPYESCVA